MFDVYCHLEYIENPEQVIVEAKKKDCRFCSAVSDLKDVRKVLKLGENNDNVFIALGLILLVVMVLFREEIFEKKKKVKK